MQTQSSERCSKGTETIAAMAMGVVTDGKGARGMFWNDVDLFYLLWVSVTQVPTFVKNSLKLKKSIHFTRCKFYINLNNRGGKKTLSS